MTCSEKVISLSKELGYTEECPQHDNIIDWLISEHQIIPFVIPISSTRKGLEISFAIQIRYKRRKSKGIVYDSAYQGYNKYDQSSYDINSKRFADYRECVDESILHGLKLLVYLNERENDQ